ncbi:MAG: hypothetical protein IPK13_07185 [Deltaproteobacteria bacterium]|nr:hypothetical protein [Deltaproteobacteria bacterium]
MSNPKRCLLAAVALSFVCANQRTVLAATVCKTDEGKVINPNNGNTTAELTATVTCTYDAGHSIRQRYVEGRVVAEEWFSREGRRTIRREFNYDKNGNQHWHGKAEEWFPSGKLKSVEQYKNGREHGPTENYAEEGTITRRAYFDEGKKIHTTKRVVCMAYSASIMSLERSPASHASNTGTWWPRSSIS